VEDYLLQIQGLFPKLIKLSKLNINLEHTKMIPHFMQVLCSSLFNLKRLEELTLNLGNNPSIDISSYDSLYKNL